VYPCLQQVLEILELQKWIIFSTILTIAVLGFSIFASTYSNFRHNSEMAEANWHLYERSNAFSWYNLSKNYRKAAIIRSCSANLCFYSIIALLSSIVSIVIAALCEKNCWFILSIVLVCLSVVLLLVAFVIFMQEKACPLVCKLFRCPVGRDLRDEDP